MMKRLLFVLCFACACALAQSSYPRDITLCWTHPTEYTDGTLIQDGDLANTRLTTDRHDGSRVSDTMIPVVGLPGERQCATMAGSIAIPGTYTNFAYAITIDDTSSDASNPAVKKFTGKPLPDSNVTAQ